MEEIAQIESIIGAPILNNYGTTEATLIACEQFSGFHRVPGSVGPVLCDIGIMGACGEPVSANETGEIVVRGPRVFPGYLDDPDANAAAFLPGGWFRTGDIGFVDEAGFLYLTGRLSELINRGGEKIAPVEVDRVLLAHPAVAEAAVFAVPDGRLGEDIVAAVVPKPGSSASPLELRWWMLDRLSPFKVPRRIWMVDALPRTRTGKVQRGALADRFLSEARLPTHALE
jgi:acyl-CoA synthetase (AMP-forming)/AMP-acid ligase II